MRDLIFGYIFIFIAMFGFLASILLRKQRLLRRAKDLKEELKDAGPR